MGSQLERIIASESDPKFATGVELTDKDGQKQTIEADFVVIGAGVSPATDFLKQSDGFPQGALRKDGGVLVDEYLRVRGLEDVFAIGDIAVYPQIPLGGETRIEHWNVAGNHGRAVGKTISGNPVPFSKVPIFWSGRESPYSSVPILPDVSVSIVEGQNLRYCGIGAGYDDIVINGNLDELKVRVGSDVDRERLPNNRAIVHRVLREGRRHRRRRLVSIFNSSLDREFHGHTHHRRKQDAKRPSCRPGF